MRGYYFITDSTLSRAGLINDVEQAVAAGVQTIQYRNKGADTKVLFQEALQLKKMCANTQACFIVNDRIDIALAVDADGVHIGQTDMPYLKARELLGRDKIIGLTVHDIEEALQAEKWGADYLGISPVFDTATKSDAGKPCGLETLKSIRDNCSIPLVGIGGIDLSNVKDIIDAGADMASAISAVVTKQNVLDEIRKFQKEFVL